MTGAEIKNKIERYTDNNLKDDLILDGILEALNWLGERGYIEGVVTIEAEVDGCYNLPDDLIRIKKIETTNINGDKVYYKNFIVDGENIRFADEGTYSVYAKRLPSINSIDDDLGIHEMLESCVVTYVKGFIRLTINDESEIGWNYIQKFERDAVKAYNILKRNQKEPAKVTVRRR